MSCSECYEDPHADRCAACQDSVCCECETESSGRIMCVTCVIAEERDAADAEIVWYKSQLELALTAGLEECSQRIPTEFGSQLMRISEEWERSQLLFEISKMWVNCRSPQKKRLLTMLQKQLKKRGDHQHLDELLRDLRDKSFDEGYQNGLNAVDNWRK